MADPKQPPIADAEPMEDVEAEPTLQFPEAALKDVMHQMTSVHGSLPIDVGGTFEQCLKAYEEFASQNLHTTNENCVTFAKVMSVVASRMLDSEDVYRWQVSQLRRVQTVCRMLAMVVGRHCRTEPLLLQTLRHIISTNTQYFATTENEHSMVVDRLDEDDRYAEEAEHLPGGLLVDVVNFFGKKGGFENIKKLAQDSKDDIVTLTACVVALTGCGLLSERTKISIVEPICILYLELLESLDAKSIKQKLDILTAAPDVFVILKNLHRSLVSTEEMQAKKRTTEAALHLVLQLLKSESFNAAMHALTELKRLANMCHSHSYPNSTMQRRHYLNSEILLQWMEDNQIFDLSFRYLHQAQYVGRLEDLLRFLVRNKKFSKEQLEKLWNAQDSQGGTRQNIHNLLSRLAWHFSSEQLEQLFDLFKESWGASKRNKEGLLQLISSLAEDDSKGHVAQKVLDLLWSLAHDDTSDNATLELAISSFLQIINFCPLDNKQDVQIHWLNLAVEELKKGEWLYPAIKVIKGLVSQFYDRAYQPDTLTQSKLIELLDKQHDDMQLQTVTQLENHCKAANDRFGPEVKVHEVFVDRRYNYGAMVNALLSLLRMFVADGSYYLNSQALKRLWTLLVEERRCMFDKRTCLLWITKQLNDIEADDEKLLFKRLVQLPLDDIDESVFNCFKALFHSINDIRRGGVPTLDLVGIDYLWNFALQTPDQKAADLFVNLLRQTYTSVIQSNTKYTHATFIDDCFARTRSLAEMKELKGAEHDVAVRCTARSLQLLGSYIQTADRIYNFRRSRLNHARAFEGQTFRATVHRTRQRQPLILPLHDHMTIGDTRLEIAHAWNLNTTKFSLFYGKLVLGQVQDKMTWHDFGINRDNILLTVKMVHDSNIRPTIEEPDPEHENALPSAILSSDQDKMALLFEFADGPFQSVRFASTSILDHIPTDATLLNWLKTQAKSDNDKLTSDLTTLMSAKGYKLLYNVETLREVLFPTFSSPEQSEELSERRVSCSLKCPMPLLFELISSMTKTVEEGEFNDTFQHHIRGIFSCLELSKHLIAQFKEQWPADISVSIVLDGLLNLVTACIHRMESESSEKAIFILRLCSRVLTSAFSVLTVCFNTNAAFATEFYQEKLSESMLADVTVRCHNAACRNAATLFLSSTAPDAHLKQLWSMLLKVVAQIKGNENHCAELFRLLSVVTERNANIESSELAQLLDQEINYLMNISQETQGAVPHEVLIGGHCQLTTVLLKRCPPPPQLPQLLESLMTRILFPASQLLAKFQAEKVLEQNEELFKPICKEPESRKLVFQMILELASSSQELFSQFVELVGQLHYAPHCRINGYDYWPEVSEKTSKYTGLKNASATCYMNSIVQQFFMQPDVRKFVLSVPCEQYRPPAGESAQKDAEGDHPMDDSTEDEPEMDLHVKVLQSVQKMFAHLESYTGSYYTPKDLWCSYRHWGEPVDIREQHDAQEFFINLIDQLDEGFKKMKYPPIMTKVFGGVFADEKIIKEGPTLGHRYEREEPFFAIPVTVKNHANLTESLATFVSGEILEGDNAYLCEKSNLKLKTLKRMCVKTLPKCLAIHLKRFDYDWERGIPVKFNDHFEFPLDLDMAPYTSEGLAAIEAIEAGKTDITVPKHMYRLAGVTVHSGQANGGHYYAFIRGRDGKSKDWFKFDDNDVSPFNPAESCHEDWFGGSYKAKVYDKTTQRNVEKLRDRWWNGYMLFYERVDNADLDIEPEMIKVAQVPNEHSCQLVKQSNLEFHHERTLFGVEYFKFVMTLANQKASALFQQSQDPQLTKEASAAIDEEACRIARFATQHLGWFVFRIDSLFRPPIEDWIETFKLLFGCSPSAINYVGDLYLNDADWKLLLLLKCPDAETRDVYREILQSCLHSVIKMLGFKGAKALTDGILTALTQVIFKFGVKCSRSLGDVLRFLHFYASLGNEYREQLLSISTLGTVMQVACSESVFNASHTILNYHYAFELFAVFVLGTDLTNSEKQDQNPFNHSIFSPELKGSSDLLPLEDTVHMFLNNHLLLEYAIEHQALCKSWSAFVKCICFQDVSSSLEIMKLLDRKFDYTNMEQAKFYFATLEALFSVEDSLQSARMAASLNGKKDSPQLHGVVHLLECCLNNPKLHGRAYALLKGLHKLSKTFPLVHELLKKPPAQNHMITGYRRLRTRTMNQQIMKSWTNDIGDCESLYRTESFENIMLELEQEVPEKYRKIDLVSYSVSNHNPNPQFDYNPDDPDASEVSEEEEASV